MALHQKGNLPEAERLYRQVLALDPNFSDALHLLGVLLHQAGQNEPAAALIRRAIAVDPHPAVFYGNLGTVLLALGRPAEAVEAYRSALQRQPEFAQAVLNLGVALQALGNFDEAEAAFRRAIELRPDLAAAFINLGNLLQRRGNWSEAAANHTRALELRPDSADAEYNLGNALLEMDRTQEAERHYRRAIALAPDLAEAHANLGNACLRDQKMDEAVACYERALALKPGFTEAAYNLGNARQTQGRGEEALQCYQRALQLNPELPQGHYNLGITLHGLGRLEEAEASFRRAFELAPGYAQAYYNLACVLQEQCRYQEALPLMERALEIQPDYPQARFALALARLQRGDFQRGWREAECRWQSEDHVSPQRGFREPLWHGKKLASGKLLLWGEQGIGDEIQFAGLLTEALRSENQILLDCEPRLKQLFARSFPQIEVVSSLQPDETQALGIAAQLPTGSLPLLYRGSEAAFADTRTPYLVADPEQLREFRQRYADGRMVVGLTWYTMNSRTGRKRSIQLEQLTPLFTLPGVRWVSLQYGESNELAEQVRQSHAGILVDETVNQFSDVDRFAAQVAAMDHVISIDNSTVHLAAALGKSVWAMLPAAADWRWMIDRTDSPWYPTLRLYRQKTMQEWEPVVRRIFEDLVALTAAQAAGRE